MLHHNVRLVRQEVIMDVAVFIDHLTPECCQATHGIAHFVGVPAHKVLMPTCINTSLRAHLSVVESANMRIQS